MLSAVIDSGHAVAPSSWRRYLAIVLQGLCAEPHRPSHCQPHPLSPKQMDKVLIGAWKLRQG
jgi:hypothetical protein